MSLPPLAQVSDVSSRYPGTLTAAQLARVPTLLGDASTVVRSYTRQAFSPATTTDKVRPIGDRVRLRQAPVTDVLSVALVDMLQSTGLLALPLGAWIWDGGQEIWIGSIQSVINLPDDVTSLLQYQTPLIQVTYAHGYATNPDAVIAVVCSMVTRVLDIPGPTSVPSQAVGALSYRLSGPALDGVMGLTDGEMRMLAPYRRAATTVELR